MSELPDDVRAAYAKHIDAWRAEAALLDHYSGFTGAFRVSIDGSDYAKSQAAAADKTVEYVWAPVKAAVTAHGVEAPKR